MRPGPTVPFLFLNFGRDRFLDELVDMASNQAVGDENIKDLEVSGRGVTSQAK